MLKRAGLLLHIAVLLGCTILIVFVLTTIHSVIAQTNSPQPDQNTGKSLAGASNIYLPFVIHQNVSALGPTPTHTPTRTPAPTHTRTSQPTFTATHTVPPGFTATITRTPTPTGTPNPISTSTPTLTSTRTPTATPTNTPNPASTSTPTATATRTPTASPTPGFDAGVFLPVGPGLVDVVPHQIVRASNDRIYMFAVNGSLDKIVRTYWSTNAGLPGPGAGFTSGPQIVETNAVISVSTAYDGLNTIHVLVNLGNGMLKDYPFDVQNGTYRAPITIAPSAQNPAGATAALDAGTCGIASEFDRAGKLHVVYWSSGNAITHISASYNPGTNTLTQLTAPVQVDPGQGNANHPSIAVSPLDDSLTVAWISGITVPGKIFVRSRAANGTWDGAVQISTSDVWTSPNAGINIDQGPSLLVDANGEKHLVYIENWRASSPFDYGRIHYVHWNGSAWTDQYINVYSHNPALAINAAGKILIIAHGYPLNPGPGCLSIDEMCVIVRNANGTWQTPSPFAAPAAGQSFDVSPSVKHSILGWNRPESIEFLFFSTPYQQPILYYGRLGSNY